jgi:hypothetical protein
MELQQIVLPFKTENLNFRPYATASKIIVVVVMVTIT